MKNRIKFSALLGILGLAVIFSFKPLEEKKTIVIDAGHGGKDLGADMYGFQEKLITETIAKKIKTLNKDSNLEIVLLRDSDREMELSERVSIINNLKPDLVVSLHVSKSMNMSVNGVDVYVPSNETFHEKSKERAVIVIDKMTEAGNLKKRRVSEAPFYILKNASCPVMTLQIGFLSNEKDRDYITSEKGQTEIALNILEAVK
ncbi:N-acetylmuramoyl-L-alanine amidase [Flavobacterium sp. FlaQc-30]|uniref:N-acetylmuramoyl-L-alanine amidase family protein n=1 Tax=Flavobacterium sp. FlaQc-30 TaxID=3374179 RepID=UPI003757443D